MNDTPGLPSEAFLTLLAKAGKPLVIVGGQAVNMWAALLLPDGAEKDSFGALLSKDCDVLGNSQTVLDVARALGFSYLLAPQRIGTPVIGRIAGRSRDGNEIVVEVLKTIHGVTPKDLERMFPIEHDGARFHLVSPITLLKAKVANAVELDQTGRNDVRHARIMIACVREFLRERHQAAVDGKFSERGLIDLLTTTREIALSEQAAQISRKHGITVMPAIPQAIARSPMERVQRFVKHQMPWLHPEWLSDPRQADRPSGPDQLPGMK